MATTNTITQANPNETVHTYTALATNDTGPAIDCRGAEEVFFMLTSGTIGVGGQVSFQGSLNGTSWDTAGLYDKGSAAKISGAALGTLYALVAVPPFVRIVVDAASGTSGLNAIVVIRKRITV